MTAIHETAYPRIRSSVTPTELAELYTPSAGELLFAERYSKSAVARLGLLTYLKVFQRLGRFPDLDSIPTPIVQHIAEASGLAFSPDSIRKYKNGRFGSRHMPLIRIFLQIKAFSDGGEQAMTTALTDAARSKDIIADIINAGIETLVRERYELPAFGTLLRAAQQARGRENKAYYRRVAAALSSSQKAAIAQLLIRKAEEAKSPWDALKREPEQPTVKRIREFVAHLRWLQSLCPDSEALAGIPETKLQRFADEARALNVSRMNEMQEVKRLTLVAALLQAQTAQATDDLAEMFIRRMGKLHWLGNEALRAYRLQQQEQTDALIGLLGKIAGGWEAGQTPEQRHLAVDGLIGGRAEAVREQCEAHLGYAGNNYLPFLPPLFKSFRGVCFEILEILRPVSTTADKSLEEAITFLLKNRDARGERLPVMFPAAEPTAASGKGKTAKAETALDLSFIPRRWWQAVTGIPARDISIRSVDRKYFELCVFSCATADLKSGDLCVPDGERYGDYRNQLISWEEYAAKVKAYCQKVGISSDPAAFVAAACKRLTDTIRKVDAAFPENAAVTIKNGEPAVKKVERLPEPEGFSLIDRLLLERLPECSIVDILTDTEHWLNWTKPFGPLSGFEGRVERPQERYIATTFCYATNMGPTQAARCLNDFDRYQVAYIKALFSKSMQFSSQAPPMAAFRHVRGDGSRWIPARWNHLR